MKKKQFNLYWAETSDHQEDWFIVASSKREAEKVHEDAEGYELGAATVSLICRVPPHKDAIVGWPTEELLLVCGGKLLPKVIDGHEKNREKLGQGGRIYQFGEHVYVEGDLLRHIVASENVA